MRVYTYADFAVRLGLRLQMLSDLAYPFWQLWYLTALVAWRVLAPYWAHLRHPVGAAILFAALDGFHSPNTYTTHRVAYYFPYFMLGIVIRQDGCAPSWLASRRLALLVGCKAG